MALATIPQTASVPQTRVCSRHVEDGAVRLQLEGYSTRFEILPHYTDRAGHIHYRRSLPSETDGGRYILDFDIVTRQVTCSCKGGTNHGTCKHRRLFEAVHNIGPQLDTIAVLYATVKQQQQRISDLETWLEAVDSDMLDRTQEARA
jgi:hypothetical protein